MTRGSRSREFEENPKQKVNQLLHDLQRDSSEAFNLIYTEMENKVFGICCKWHSRGNDRSLAWDASQHVFRKLWAKRLTIKTNLYGWICTTANNIGKDNGRKIKRSETKNRKHISIKGADIPVDDPRGKSAQWKQCKTNRWQ